MQTETLDRLYLEWSQFTKAKTQRELALEVALLKADEAINPPDRGGISMETWNERLKEATKTIRNVLTAAKGS